MVFEIAKPVQQRQALFDAAKKSPKVNSVEGRSVGVIVAGLS
jgi:hypothetical protein